MVSKSPSGTTSTNMIALALILRDISARDQRGGHELLLQTVELVVGENKSLSDAAYGCGGGADVGLGRL